MSVIFLIRHGDAENHSPDGRDSTRPLSPKGRDDIRLQAQFLSHAEEPVDLIYHSPFVRAVQTARILQSQLQAPLQEESALIPCGNFDNLLFQMKGVEKKILFVSHLPLIAEFACALTGDSIRFLPGTLVKVMRHSTSDYRGRLLWIHHPYENTE